jgi:uncharacterized membrane protein YfcA
MLIIALIIIGFLSGVLSAIFGIGGGIIATSALLFLGMPASVAVVNSLNMMLAITASSLFVCFKHQALDVKIGVLLAIGGAIGAIIGVQLYGVLKALHILDLVIRLLYLPIIAYLIYSTLKSMRRHLEHGERVSKPRQPNPAFTIFLGMLAGILGAVLGIGGGLIVIPYVMHYLMLPQKKVSGTSHLMVFSIALISLIIHHLNGDYANLNIAIYLIVFSAIGAFLGVMISHKLSRIAFNIGFLLLLVTVGGKFISDIASGKHLEKFPANQLKVTYENSTLESLAINIVVSILVGLIVSMSMNALKVRLKI